MSDTRQGKCTTCKVAFRWPAKIMPLYAAWCPRCGDPLQSTTHLLKWPWFNDELPITSGEAYRLAKKLRRK